MEFGQSGDVMKKRISLGLSVADEKIKLIDILSEDDYFLVDSPLSHHSIQPPISSSELERMEESRPSFLRRSLAWDSAFYINSGVLDPDELFFINNGAKETSLLPATHEVRNRRSESESTQNDVGFSADWFELQPSIIESKSSKALKPVQWNSKSGLKQNGQSSKNVDGSSRNKIKSDRTSIGKSIDIQSRSTIKTGSSARRASSNRYFSGISNLNMGNKSMKTTLGQMEEKPTYKSSSNLHPTNNSLSSAKFSPIFTPTAAAASNLSKRTTELKKAHNFISSPTSNSSRVSVKKKGIGNISAATHSTSFCSSPANTTRVFPSVTLLSPVHKQRRSVDSKDVKEASNLQSSLQFPNHNGLVSAKGLRPSGLRPPSPRLRYFDETTPQYAERSRKVPQKKLETRSAAIDEQNGTKELATLCRNFEAVALESEKISGGVAACSVVVKDEKKQPSSKMASSRRTPLADKTSKCNFSGAFAPPTEPKKDKLMRRTSSVRYG